MKKKVHVRKYKDIKRFVCCNIVNNSERKKQEKVPSQKKKRRQVLDFLFIIL